MSSKAIKWNQIQHDNNDQQEIVIPQNKILKFDYDRLSDLAKRQLFRLVKKLSFEKRQVLGSNRRLYVYEINKLLIHEGVVIEN